MGVVFQQVILLLIFIAIGYILCKTKKADNSHSKLLSVLGFHVFLPANLFNTFAKNFTVEYLTAKYPIVLVGLVFVVVMYFVGIPVSKLLSRDKYQQAIYRYSMVSPNYGYMGYALAGSLLDAAGLLDVMMFAIPMSLYTYTLGYCSLTGSKMTVKKLINPVNIGMLAGAAVGLSGITLPALVSDLLSKAVACMGPISMLLTGMVISEYDMRQMLTNKPVYVMTALRLLVIPLVTGLVLKLLGLDFALKPTLSMVAVSCGLNTIVFPKLAGQDCKTGAALACVSSVLCCATIPLCFWIFGIQF